MTDERRTRYRVADRDRVDEAMGYALARLSRLSAGQEWAQTLLDEMVAEGYIEPRPEESTQ